MKEIFILKALQNSYWLFCIKCVLTYWILKGRFWGRVGEFSKVVLTEGEYTYSTKLDNL